MSLHADRTVSYEKYHGTSNDFIIIDADEFIPNRYSFATTYCDRTDGAGTDLDIDEDDHVGADGVLFLALEEKYSPPRVIMTLVQPDGSTAAMCGNGARCAAAWAAEQTGASEVMVDTQAGTRHATVHDDGSVTIEMGVPAFDPRDVPLTHDGPLIEEELEGFSVTAVNTGVPHAVIFVDDVDDVDLETVGPTLRYADVFPEGANVTFASPSENGFDQRTYERGVEGETQSCGTGAVAVVAAAKRLGRLDDGESVTVSPPGGDLEISVPDDAPATLRGPVAHEFAGELGRDPSSEL
ncbi:diaminopimelate epimerase [Halogranum rubrum]|uniref:Diaminopimelate epimerase n=1 Tax=Halogranum salarium B-1 TaxID=1210908 RepID=J3EYH4_9EURY|nr:diaminopimelate epimerase [Halogranum salarium]EJN60407.1 diaminopimelate epimerase [Halogranum salarium B-1]